MSATLTNIVRTRSSAATKPGEEDDPDLVIEKIKEMMTRLDAINGRNQVQAHSKTV